MNNTSSLFAGLRNAKVTERGVWLREGQYVVRVKRGLYKTTRKSGDAFILEFGIEKSNYEEVKRKQLEILTAAKQPFDMVAEKLLPNQVGTSASWYQSLKDIDVGFGALKGFAASILGCKSEDPQFLEEVEGFMVGVVNAGAINGMLIPVETRIVPKKNGDDFTQHVWGKILTEAA